MHQTDLHFMQKDLTLAKKGLGKTSPNPCVGAILVKNNKIIGQGYHQKAGEAHAEINALNNCRENPQGATLYVTLEPCCHFGKTPPCTNAIIKDGIKKVVMGLKDPNPLVNGKGMAELQRAGIKVVSGFLEDEIKKLNEIYLKYITTQLPFVALKVAMSLDGKIATAKRKSKWITSEKSRKLVHRLRSQYDAILVGINTVLKDDPHLGVRMVKGKDPLRIILDSNLRVPLKAKVLRDSNVLIVTTDQAPQDKLAKLAKNKIKVLVLGKKIDLKKLLNLLGKDKITSILIEGGAQINASFLENKLVDKVYFFIAPKIIGGEKALSPIGGQGITILNKAVKIKEWKWEKIGKNLLIEGYIKN